MIKERGKILLVLTSAGTPDEAISYAVDRARKDGVTLVALYILTTGPADSVFESFTDTGFIGDKPTTELSEAIMKDFRQRGYEELGRVQIKAMEEGVDFEPMMEQGDVLGNVLKVVDAMDIGAAILVRKKKKPLFKYFSISVVDEIKEKAKCEVVVFGRD
ncbi:MAG: universal stress protein [Deltaproteobacteria bacterium]